MSKHQEKQEIVLDLALEAPPTSETSSVFLSDEEGLADLNARFTVADSLLRLVTRDLLFKDFMREMLLVVMKVVKAEAGSVVEVDHASNSLFFRSVVGQSSDSITQFIIPMGQGIVGHVAESKQALMVDDVGDNKLHLNTIAKAVGFEVRNLIAVPIVIRGRTFGVIELLNRVGEKNFTPADLEVLRYFCEMATHALETRFMIAWANQNGASRKNDDDQGVAA